MSGRHSNKKYSLTPLGYAALFCVVALVVLIIFILIPKNSDNPSSDSSNSVSSASSAIDISSAVSSVEEPKDTTAPVIEGAKDISVYIGETVSYRSGITVTDDTDTNPTLSIESSGVDLSKVGSYNVIYTATDASGNEATETVTVTVKEKPDDYIDSETIYDAVDKKLSTLVNDNMTLREKAKAIYNWAKWNIPYKSSSDKSDYMMEAYRVLKGNSTDCFGYFAVTKLMFERLGIPNIDVKKVKNYEGDSNHYWSLVSLDGGETYYHFDATPRRAGGEFFMLTDAELDAYSTAHKNSHNRDKSLYPATPEE